MPGAYHRAALFSPPRRDFCEWHSGTGAGFPFFAELSAAPSSFARNEEIYGQGDTAIYIYRVIQGAVRLRDAMGRICAFYFPGDIFGAEAGGLHPLCAEALGQTELLVINRRVIDGDPQSYGRLQALAEHEIGRLQEHQLLLRAPAEDRLKLFIFEMATRIGAFDDLLLPMSIHDIADYLHFTPEATRDALRMLEHEAGLGRAVELSRCEQPFGGADTPTKSRPWGLLH